jgi:hypothetical protein
MINLTNLNFTFEERALNIPRVEGRLIGVDRASSLTQEKFIAKKAQRENAGQIILGRQRHVKRMREEQLDIGTWNVNTMLKAGKMQEIADQIVGSQIQRVALQ